MALSQRLELKLEQKLNTVLTAEQKLLIQQQLKIEIKQIADALYGPQDEVLNSVLKKLIDEVPDPAIQEGLRELTSGPALSQVLIGRGKELASPNQDLIKQVAASYLHKSNEGEFKIQTDDQATPEIAQISIEVWDKAIKNPVGLKKESTDIQEIMKMNQERGTVGDEKGALGRITEIQQALLIAELSKEALQAIENGIVYLFAQKDVEGDSYLLMFFRELMILENMVQDISERIQKRFASNFGRIQGKAASQFENAFLNTVGEFSLVSMGVISPAIFATEYMDVDPAVKNYLEQDPEAVRLRLKELAERYNLKTEGRVFWNRWQTLKTPPSPKSDDQVRDFITQILREDGGRIIDSARFADFFKELQDESASLKGEDKEYLLRGKITEKIKDPEFQEALLQLMRDKWLPMF